MLFNSLHFFIFFPIVFAIYWLILYCIKGQTGVKSANIFILLSSYYFYMCWSAEYAILLFASTFITYLAGLGIGKAKKDQVKKLYLTASIVLNISILFFFKYFSFGAQIVADIMNTLNIKMTVPDLGILLPVGISFYIFQALGYSIDVYRGTTKVEKDLFTYALFVSFFPQLVAGPIERSSNLLPQFKERHKFDYDKAMAGIRLMIWGYFLKLVLADRCAEYVDAVFNHVAMHNGGSYLLSALIFTFQIYGDFAGYSLIAIGVAKVMGFDLMQNFRQPYLAWSISDFWHRWHISLSTWFKDYIYIPLGGNRVGEAKCYRNLMVTFLVSGIWHGANWTFVVWGTLHGILQCLERLIGWHKKKWHGLSRFAHTLLTFVLVVFAWIIFRANNISDAITMITGIFTNFKMPYIELIPLLYIAFGIIIVSLRDIIVEYSLNVHISDSRYAIVRYFYIVFMITIILTMGSLTGGKFIYFQF